jgi:hypothetical protein
MTTCLRFMSCIFLLSALSLSSPVALAVAAETKQTVCEQEKSTQSLDTLQFTSCLLKVGEKSKKYYGYKLTFTNIGARKIFLIVEQDPLRRFDASLTAGKIEVLEREIDDSSHMIEPKYAPFSQMPMEPGKSLTFETYFFDFKHYLKKQKIAQGAMFRLSFRPPSFYYIFDGEEINKRFDRRREEFRADKNKVSKYLVFEDFQIDWKAPKLRK